MQFLVNYNKINIFAFIQRLHLFNQEDTSIITKVDNLNDATLTGVHYDRRQCHYCSKECLWHCVGKAGLPAGTWLVYIHSRTHNSDMDISISGIGLLSKHKIISHERKHLTYHSGPDKNKRVILHAEIDMGQSTLNVIVVHFSYDKKQQCGNSEEILQYIIGV